MRAPPNAAVRRFTVVWTASTLVKVAALALVALLVLTFVGGL